MQELLGSKEDRYKSANEAVSYIESRTTNDTEFIQLIYAASGQLQLALISQAKALLGQREGDDLRKNLVTFFFKSNQRTSSLQHV